MVQPAFGFHVALQNTVAFTFRVLSIKVVKYLIPVTVGMRWTTEGMFGITSYRWLCIKLQEIHFLPTGLPRMRWNIDIHIIHTYSREYMELNICVCGVGRRGDRGVGCNDVTMPLAEFKFIAKYRIVLSQFYCTGGVVLNNRIEVYSLVSVFRICHHYISLSVCHKHPSWEGLGVLFPPKLLVEFKPH